MTTSRYLALCVFVFTSFGAISNNIYGQSKEDLLQLVKAYRNQFSDIDFTCNYRLEKLGVDPTQKRKMIPKMDVHIKHKGIKLLDDYKVWKSEKAEQPKHGLRIYNGQNSLSYSENAKSGSIAPGHDRAVEMHNWIYQSLKWPTSPSHLPSERLNIYLDLLEFIKSDQCKILPNRETIHGAETVVLEWENGREKVWLDIEHGGIIRRSEFRHGVGGPLVWRRDITELHEVSGIYFPAKVIQTRFANHTNPEKMWNTPIWQATVTVRNDELKINSGLTDKDFKFEFPPGTKVHDMVVGLSYTTGAASDARGEVLDDMFIVFEAKKMTKAPEVVQSINVSDDEEIKKASDEESGKSPNSAVFKPQNESHSYTALFIAIAIGLSVLLVLLVYIITRKGPK